MASASASPMICSATGSHRKFRPTSRAMLMRCPTVTVRWPISTSAFGLARDLMQSNQFSMWPRATEPLPSHLFASLGSGGFFTKCADWSRTYCD